MTSCLPTPKPYTTYSVFICTCGLDSSSLNNSISPLMYEAAIQIISVLEGSFCCGGRGINRRKILMFLFKVWTLFLSRALASRLCLLIPVSLGPLRFGVFLLGRDFLSLVTLSILQISEVKSYVAKRAVNWF